MKALALVTALTVLVVAVAASAKSYKNPVVVDQMADPGVFYDSHKHHMYIAAVTGGTANGNKFKLSTSKDLVSWSHTGFTFPKGSKGSPKWAHSDFWAPEISYVGNGNYVLVFSAADKSGQRCIGIAHATDPLGPWHDLGKPFISKAGGTNIDPTLYKSKGGKWYLYWKTFPRSIIWVREMNAKFNGFAAGSTPKQLIVNDLSWEGAVAEGPHMYYRKPYYYLFYSGGQCCTNKPTYAVGVARSKSPTGPFKKKGAPIMRSNGAFKGPGHCSVLDVHGTSKAVMVYHAWRAGHVGGRGERNLMVDVVRWSRDGWPYFHGDVPSSSKQPVP